MKYLCYTSKNYLIIQDILNIMYKILSLIKYLRW